MTRVLLVGYSGHRNFGDDLLLEQAYEELGASCELTIWSNAEGTGSDYLKSWFPEAEIVISRKIGRSLFQEFDRVLYFGGGVFFDYAELGIRQLGRQLVSISLNYRHPKVKGVKFGAIGLGLGPFTNWRSRLVARYRLSTFSLLAVRDEESFVFMNQPPFGKTPFRGCDLSLLRGLRPCASSIESSNKILICPRVFPHGSGGDEYNLRVAKWAKHRSETDSEILVFGFQSSHDEPVMEIYRSLGLETRMWDPDTMTTTEVFDLFSTHNLVVSARMHGIYVAGLTGIPSLGINVHPKVPDACAIVGNSSYIDIDFSVAELTKAASRVTTQIETTDLREYQYLAKQQYAEVRLWLT